MRLPFVSLTYCHSKKDGFSYNFVSFEMYIFNYTSVPKWLPCTKAFSLQLVLHATVDKAEVYKAYK